MKKKSKLVGLLILASLILTACGTSEVTASSPDLWERFVYFFAVTIRFLSFNGSTGIGIILFTLIIRTVLLPVFQLQINASRKMQEAQPLVKELQAKYPGRDMESRSRLAEETQKLYKELGVKPSASFWPLQSRAFALAESGRDRPLLYFASFSSRFHLFEYLVEQ